MPRELVSSKTVSWKGWLVLLHKKLQTSSFEGIGCYLFSLDFLSFLSTSLQTLGLLHPPASSGTHQIDLIDVPSYPKLGQGFASQDPSKGKIAAALEEIDVEDLDLDENFEGPHHPTNRWSFPEHRAGYL
nr:hypothetical protein Iba_chr11bCG15050 [Ipomoea batatas]